ncbi:MULTISPECIES: DUF262 domain-containing protein [pseudomallei group]|uniref:GmrSD restriction endonuclease domain-containing protein n=1 Tax=pseudomallei group TaxID=111527 RepID=UPI0005387211|nr:MULTISPECIES: DUF262 domain-containing protein [pseudomallei group]KGV65581.1 hypothetical protein X944_3861 [Burkholderia pseudomallei MSHR3964]KGV92921.1 hypothetical protein X892_3908 [Burkholderia pseudomallei MSHR3960]KGV95058.1 hypothetical protein X879_3777 [Burkholderia pseudomallei MSHR3951]
MANDKANELELEDETDEGDERYHEYSLTSYPTDFTLSVLYDQWKAGELVVPDFQRGYVWNIEQASKLIESFLVGLPIPQVFLYVDDDHKLIVIDGQQRITSIAYFFEGFFGNESRGTRKVFRLTGLSDKSPYDKRTFSELDATTQRKLKSAPLRAINIRQLKPEADNSSVYQIFERLNTGGTPLKSQEIRNAVYRGAFNDLLKQFNEIEDWRRLLGKDLPDKHMRDVELLLRVFALTYFRDQYDGKMKDFLSSCMYRNRDAKSEAVAAFTKNFPEVAKQLATKLPGAPFQRGGPINSAMLEATFCSCLSDVQRTTDSPLDVGYAKLRADKDFLNSISQGTNAIEKVHTRFDRATALLFDQK